MPPSTAGRWALVKMSGDPVAFTGEAFTTSDDQHYVIADGQKSVWDPDTDVTVYDDAVESIEAYTINRLTGEITFPTVDAGRGPITADGDYLPLSRVAKAKAFAVKFGEPPIDDTNFDSPGWEENIPNINSISGSLTRSSALLTDAFFDAMAAGSRFVLEFWIDRRLDYMVRAWVVCTADNVNADTKSVVGGDIEFRGSQDIDRHVAALAWGNSTTVPVFDVPLSVLVDPDTAALTVGSPTAALTGEVYDQHGDLLVGLTPTSWTSTNTAVATVDSGGTVTRVANGTCRVFAHYNELVSNPCRVTCTTA